MGSLSLAHIVIIYLGCFGPPLFMEDVFATLAARKFSYIWDKKTFPSHLAPRRVYQLPNDSECPA